MLFFLTVIRANYIGTRNGMMFYDLECSYSSKLNISSFGGSRILLNTVRITEYSYRVKIILRH